MNWDDLRHVLAVSRTGSLLSAANELQVNHTTVGRRLEVAETALGVRLFTRTTSGLRLTAEGERLLAPMQKVEDAVLALERTARARGEAVEGLVRITSPETFGISYLAPRLASLSRKHPGLTVELSPSGAVLDLGRGEAEIALRFFRSRDENLVVRRVGTMAYALYASAEYLARRPVKHARELAEHGFLLPPRGPNVLETRWVESLCASPRVTFVSEVTLSLLAAVKTHAGLTVLPRYLGDAEPLLQRVPMPNEPSEALWLTVHRDLKQAPRVRVVLDFIAAALKADEALLAG